MDTVLGSTGWLSSWESDNVFFVCGLCHLLVMWLQIIEPC